jgi:hypothetical protein
VGYMMPRLTREIGMKTKQSPPTGVQQGSSSTNGGPVLDEQYADLIETVWACERLWTRDDRIDAAIRYGARR